MAIACFLPLPAFISVRIFAEIADRLEPFFNGIPTYYLTTYKKKYTGVVANYTGAVYCRT